MFLQPTLIVLIESGRLQNFMVTYIQIVKRWLSRIQSQSHLRHALFMLICENASAQSG
jgi:hypothetical protein